MDIKKFIRPNIYSLRAYEAEEIPCRVKLDANESPYGLSPKVLTNLASSKARKLFRTINRYPDPQARQLKKIISRYFGIKPANILQGNGSDELIYYLITTFGGPVLYPSPTFSMYGIISRALGEKSVGIPLDEEFDIDLAKFLNTIKSEKPKLIFISSPNNPTGNCFSSEKVLKIIESAAGKSLVILDEAYQPFASDRGFLPMLGDYENLLILRTLSKIGLAGLRVGLLIAGEETIHEVNKVRLPFNLNSLSQALAIMVLSDKKTLIAHIKSVVSQREVLFNELEQINGIIPYPSEANFILLRMKAPDTVYKRLLKKGVLVRNMKGVVEGCLRVTVGTPEEDKVFIKALKMIMRGNK